MTTAADFGEGLPDLQSLLAANEATYMGDGQAWDANWMPPDATMQSAGIADVASNRLLVAPQPAGPFQTLPARVMSESMHTTNSSFGLPALEAVQRAASDATASLPRLPSALPSPQLSPPQQLAQPGPPPTWFDPGAGVPAASSLLSALPLSAASLTAAATAAAAAASCPGVAIPPSLLTPSASAGADGSAGANGATGAGADDKGLGGSGGSAAGGRRSAGAAAPQQPISHSSVEKQRRDRLNELIDQLGELAPPPAGTVDNGVKRAKHVILADAAAALRRLHTDNQTLRTHLASASRMLAAAAASVNAAAAAAAAATATATAAAPSAAAPNAAAMTGGGGGISAFGMLRSGSGGAATALTVGIPISVTQRANSGMVPVQPLSGPLAYNSAPESLGPSHAASCAAGPPLPPAPPPFMPAPLLAQPPQPPAPAPQHAAALASPYVSPPAPDAPAAAPTPALGAAAAAAPTPNWLVRVVCPPHPDLVAVATAALTGAGAASGVVLMGERLVPQASSGGAQAVVALEMTVSCEFGLLQGIQHRITTAVHALGAGSNSNSGNSSGHTSNSGGLPAPLLQQQQQQQPMQHPMQRPMQPPPQQQPMQQPMQQQSFASQSVSQQQPAASHGTGGSCSSTGGPCSPAPTAGCGSSAAPLGAAAAALAASPALSAGFAAAAADATMTSAAGATAEVDDATAMMLATITSNDMFDAAAMEASGDMATLRL